MQAHVRQREAELETNRVVTAWENDVMNGEVCRYQAGEAGWCVAAWR